MIRTSALAVLVLMLAACAGSSTEQDKGSAADSTQPGYRFEHIEPEMPALQLVDSLELRLMEAGLSNVQEVVPGILVELKYTTTDNFLAADVYGDLTNCYLQPDVAEKLATAQVALKAQRPDLTLLVYDGVRPRSIQRKMWNRLDSVPVKERVRYVSNPANGSLHNFGAAVDLTLADTLGNALDMGTPFDYFGELAFPRLEWELVRQGKLTREQVDNRALLRAVMYQAGFSHLETEWWHFNACTREEARERYQIVE